MNKPDSVLVAIATYQRREELTELLDSLVPALAGIDAKVLVVDNDPAETAREVVASHQIDAMYDVCPDPGIAQVRNVALGHRHGYEFIAFVDDDETVDPNWMTELLECAKAWDADVVAGRVDTLFPQGAPAWITAGGFVQRPVFPTGTPRDLFATNNALVRTDIFPRLVEPRFDVAFSRSGGSDRELSWRLHRAGGRIIWCDTAIAREIMPADRLTKRWVFRRLVRFGNVYGRLMLREQSRGSVFWWGFTRLIYGLLRLLSGVIVHRRVRFADADHFTRGIGICKACLGSVTHEYSRG